VCAPNPAPSEFHIQQLLPTAPLSISQILQITIDTDIKPGMLPPMTWFIQSKSVLIREIRGKISSLPWPSAFSVFFALNFQRPTAQNRTFPWIFGLVCTYVHLRAPACTKMKNFRNRAQTARNCT
jgi:hypothetical protein